MRPFLDEFIRSLSRTSNEDETNAAFREALNQIGFDSFAYLGLRVAGAGERPRPYFITSYPVPWVETYDSSGYLRIDPVLLEAPGRALPWIWGGQSHRRRASEPQRKFFDEAQSFGIQCGLAVPVHAAGGEFGLVSIAWDGSESDFQKLLKERQHDLHLAAVYLHNHATRFVESAAEAEAIRITIRERECLLWSALGKSSWEIGQIIGVSEPTVNFHLKNAMAKLGVHSRVHAVVRACALGLISP